MGLQLLVQAKQVEGDTDYVVLQVDVTNAFNSISRDAVAKMDLVHCSVKAGIFAKAMSGSAKATHGGHCGWHQGLDKCSPRKLAWESWYLDDGRIVGKPKDVLARLQGLPENNLEPLGLRLKLSKCQLLGPRIQAERQVTPVYPKGLILDEKCQ